MPVFQNRESPSRLAQESSAEVLKQEAVSIAGMDSMPPEPAMFGSIIKLAVGRWIVIVLSLLTAPILSRLFQPHAFGALGVLSTVVSIIAAFASLSYVSAIPLAASTVERRNLFVLCAIIGILVTGVVAAGSLLGANLLAAAFHEPDVAKYALFLPLLFLAGGVRQLLDTTLSCQRRFRAVAVRNVLESLVTRAVQLGACLFGLIGSPLALIVGTLIGSLVSAVSSGLASIRDIFRRVEEPLCLADLGAAAFKHRKFPMIHLWTQTISAAATGLPALLLGMRFSVEAVGLYGMAFAMVTLPLQLFAGGASQVFYVETGERVARGQSVRPATQQLVRMLATLTAFPLAVVLVLGPLLFDVVLGHKWHEAGIYAQILVPTMAMAVFVSPLSLVFPVVNRQGEGFVFILGMLVARFVALYFGGLFLGPRLTLGLYVVANAAVVVWLIWRALFLCGVSRRWATMTIVSSYVLPLLLLAPAGFLYWAFSAKVAALGAMSIACVAFAMVIYLRHPETIKPLLARVPIAWVSRLGKPTRLPEDDK